MQPNQIVLIALIVNAFFHSALSVDKIAWTQTPNTVQVLEGTNALFPWKHNAGASYVDITWYNLGTENNPQRETILLRSGHTCIPYAEERLRPTCGRGVGDATMTLNNVKTDDSGKYEAKLTLPHPHPGRIQVIYDTATLNVVQRNALTYNVTIDGSTEQSGYGMTSRPSRTLDFHLGSKKRLNITVDVNSDSPTPNISVWKVIGDNKQDEPICYQQRFCHRFVGFCSDDLVNNAATHAHVVIKVDFGVQNVNVLNYSLDVTIHPKKQSSPVVAKMDSGSQHFGRVPDNADYPDKSDDIRRSKTSKTSRLENDDDSLSRFTPK